jgi:predicted DNA-binding protein
MTMAKSTMHKVFSLRLGDEVDLLLVQLTKTFGVKTRSKMIRKIIIEAAGQGPSLSDDNLDSFREGVRQLAALGRNINQIARAVNSGQAQGCPWEPDLMNATVRCVVDLQKVVADIVLRSRNRWVKSPDRQANHG